MTNNTLQDNKKETNARFVSIDNRPVKSDLPASFWQPIVRNNGFISWKGIVMLKSPFQITMTQALIQELQPKTIIEFGSYQGGSAVWLADIQSLSVTNGKVISIDVNSSNLKNEAKQNPHIQFIQGDSIKVEKIFSQEALSKLEHPLLLIEDAHINITGILDYFHKNIFQPGDYFIIEDTNLDYNNAWRDAWKENAEETEHKNNRIIDLTHWLLSKNNMYLIDTKYVDPFGIKNASKNWNSVIKKIY